MYINDLYNIHNNLYYDIKGCCFPPAKNQQVEKTRGTCTPDQGSGATLGVLGYASA